MRKFLIIVMASMFFFGASEAGKKKDLAGKIENGVYTDDAYNFSLAIPEAWDSNIKKEMFRSSSSMPPVTRRCRGSRFMSIQRH